jgi:hypothetical protein
MTVQMMMECVIIRGLTTIKDIVEENEYVLVMG